MYWSFLFFLKYTSTEMTMTTETINTTRTPTPIPVIIFPLAVLGELSSADKVGSRVCRPLAVTSVGMLVAGLDLCRAGIFVIYIMLQGPEEFQNNIVQSTLICQCVLCFTVLNT